MARPSGECEGQSCYTTGDIAQIQAEIVNKNAEVINAIATLTVKQLQLSSLNVELQAALANQCSC